MVFFSENKDVKMRLTWHCCWKLWRTWRNHNSSITNICSWLMQLSQLVRDWNAQTKQPFFFVCFWSYEILALMKFGKLAISSLDLFGDVWIFLSDGMKITTKFKNVPPQLFILSLDLSPRYDLQLNVLFPRISMKHHVWYIYGSIRVLQKNMGTPKWMVYNGRPY